MGGSSVSRERARGAVTPGATRGRGSVVSPRHGAATSRHAARRGLHGNVGEGGRRVVQPALREPAGRRLAAGRRGSTPGASASCRWLVRAFLLGYHHGRIVPGHGARLPGSATGMGRIDCLVDGVAVEFAVRRPNDGRGPPSEPGRRRRGEGAEDVRGPGAPRRCFDFSSTPFERWGVEEFRDWPSLGRGRHRRSGFNVSYHYVDPDSGGNEKLPDCSGAAVTSSRPVSTVGPVSWNENARTGVPGGKPARARGLGRSGGIRGRACAVRAWPCAGRPWCRAPRRL